MPFIPDKKPSGFIPDSQPKNAGGLVFTGRGGVDNPQGQAAVKSATEQATKQVQKKFESQQNTAVQDVIDSLVSSGTPLTNITPEQLLGNDNVKNAGIQDIKTINDILSNYRQSKIDKITNSLKASLEELVYLSDKIPTGSGFTGRYITAAGNNIQQGFGYLTAKDVFEPTVKSTLATIAKAFGEVGNLSEFDQKSYEDLLKLIGSPQIEVRQEARDSLFRRLNKGLGVDVGKITPFEVNKKMNQKANTPSLENKLTPEQEKRAQELLKML